MKTLKYFIMAVIIIIFGIIILFPSCNTNTIKDGDNSEEEYTIDFESKYIFLNGLENFIPPANFDKKINGITYGSLDEVSYDSKTTGATRKCYVYTPPDYDPQKTYPVLYLLHGIGGTHTEWLGGAPNEILSNLIASGEAKPMIVVMPNIRAQKNDTDMSDMYGPAHVAAFDNFINDLRDDLMPFIKKNYKVSNNRERCAIAGLSMGGREALFIGVKMPDTFAYIGAFSAAPGLIGASPYGQLAANELTLPEEYKSNTFIMLNLGNSDSIALDPSDSYALAFENNETPHFYYKINGGHDFGVWKNGLYYFAKCIF
jgi:enterochelin esterase-like enzyme